MLACDLPFLSDEALEQLLAERDPAARPPRTAAHMMGCPNPCAPIWEPKAAARTRPRTMERARDCPRKFLMNHAVRILEPQDRRALDNVNTPEEYAQALQRSNPTTGANRHAAQDPILRADARASRPLRRDRRNAARPLPADLYSELRRGMASRCRANS